MKKLLLVLTLLVLSASFVNAQAHTAPPAPSVAVGRPAVSEQMTSEDVQKVFADLSKQLAEAQIQFASMRAILERQRDGWKHRAETAEKELDTIRAEQKPNKTNP
jgi:TolA-binding protein